MKKTVFILFIGTAFMFSSNNVKAQSFETLYENYKKDSNNGIEVELQLENKWDEKSEPSKGLCVNGKCIYINGLPTGTFIDFKYALIKRIESYGYECIGEPWCKDERVFKIGIRVKR